MNRFTPVVGIAVVLVLGWVLLRARPKASGAVESWVQSALAAERAPRRLEGTTPGEAARVVASAPATEAVTTEHAPDAPGPTLEVIVLVEDAPVSAAEVSIVPFEEFSEFLVGLTSPEPLGRARTDASGLARFELAGSAALGLAAVGPDGSIGRTRIVPPADPVAFRAVLPLGSASLEGVVHDLDGGLAADVRVIAHQDRRSGEEGVWFVARTDAGGNYRLTGLAGGPGRLVTAMVLDLPLGETAPFVLQAGELRRIDFGSASGRASWSGILQRPSGMPIPGPERLVFVSDGNATWAQGYVDERGRFVARLIAGVYTARLGSAAGAILGRAEVSGDLVQDLVAPRVFLHGAIRYVGTKHPIARGPENDVALLLERADGTRCTSGMLRGTSSYGFVGLEPGTYVLTARPWVLGGTANGRRKIEIPSDRGEVELDLELTDP